GILITVVSQVLVRAGREDIATLATLAGLIVVLMMVVNMVSEFFESIRVMFRLD
ncbi:MAG: stage III sporulation protein AC, partial [Clostridia bacterium]|nr:stage III sporulation protein AC [Clostridia bacterium]